MSKNACVLFLGQQHLALQGVTDHFLSQAVNRYCAPGTIPDNYFRLFDSSAGLAPEITLDWMDRRCQQIPLPEPLKTISAFSWNAVYTSSIDSIWFRPFRNEWREIQPIFAERQDPSDPRNKFLLHCTHLFGCINRSEIGERPPLTKFEWQRRKQIAIALARRIPDVLTPLGLLFIEGYPVNGDWFPTEELYPIVEGLNAGQVHLFSALDVHREDEFLAELAKQGKLIFHQVGLAEFLENGKDEGRLRLGRRPAEAGTGRQLTIRDTVHEIPRELWNLVSRSAIILDDGVLEVPPVLSDVALYEEFRNALDRSEGRPRWPHYARNLFFHRDFEKRLWEAITKALSLSRMQNWPVILHGQTGSGKTVSLASMAYQAKQDTSCAVLFIERKTSRPTSAHVEQFAQWVETLGAERCLVVWDGMLEPRDYDDFLGHLTNRGRKVSLVGSCYSLEKRHAKSARFIHAPARFQTPEAEAFVEYVKRFARLQLPDGASTSLARLTPDEIKRSDSFLVALYRLLPSSRKSIKVGVYQETDDAQERIRKRALTISTPHMNSSALAEAFISAGLATARKIEDSERKQLSELDKADLSGLVMVPGRYGLKVPLELLMRALGDQHFALFANLFDDVDIFRWYDDAVGNIEIGARNSLEARLVVEAKLGGPRKEVEFIKQLLIEVQEKGAAPAEQREVSFAVELIKRIREEAEHSPVLALHFRDLADTLTRLREDRGIQNPRLLLQEANMLREWAIDQDKRKATTTSEEKLKAFEQAEAVCRRGLELVGDAPSGRDFKARLLVELASALASKLRHLLAAKGDTDLKRDIFRQVQTILAEARLLDPSNYYAIDVLAWSTEAVLKNRLLNDVTAGEAIADVFHSFHSAPTNDFDWTQLEKYNQRQLSFAEFVQDEPIAERAFRALLNQGSSAGYYLRALRLSGLRGNSSPGADLTAVHTALVYLKEHQENIKHDSRCLELMLDLWWMVNSRKRLFEGERISLPFSEVRWRELLTLILDIEGTGQSNRPANLAFLRGLALFHLEEVAQSLSVFAELDRNSEQVKGPRRIIQSYVASTPQGTPRRFYGEVRWAEGNRGKLFVEGLRNDIPFRPLEFGLSEPTPGTAVGELSIGFNFRGPIAVPGHLKNK